MQGLRHWGGEGQIMRQGPGKQQVAHGMWQKGDVTGQHMEDCCCRLDGLVNATAYAMAWCAEWPSCLIPDVLGPPSHVLQGWFGGLDSYRAHADSPLRC